MSGSDRDRSRSHRHRSRSRSRSKSPDASYSKYSSRRRDHSSSYSRSNRHRDSRSERRRQNERSSSRSHSREGLDSKETPIPQAVVTEEGGEISCSVEETNRIRAQLGLPPLEINDPKEEKQVDDDGFVFVDHSKILEEEQIRKKLEKSRQDRERDEYQNLKGKGLGDLLSEEGKEMDVKAWLERSKEKQEAALDAMEEEEDKEEEMEQRRREAKVSLAGLKVAHDITEIGEGETILTLRDAPLLDEKGQIADTEDVLEDTALVQMENYKEARKQREKSKMPIYTGYDDDEFDSDFDEEDRLLPQYNEPKKKQKSFTLTDTGVSEEDLKRSKLAAQQQLQEAPKNTVSAVTASTNSIPAGTQISLGSLLAGISEEKKVASEYFSKEEMAQFRKKKKRNRHVRKSEIETETPLKLQEIVDDESTSRRELRDSREAQEEEAAMERKQGYERAREKEEQKNRILRGEEKGEMGDDVLLTESLLRARRAVLGQRKKTPEEIAAQIQVQREAEEAVASVNAKAQELEEVSEFTKRFKTLMKEKQKETITSAPKVSLPEKEEEEEEEKEEEEEEMKEEEEDLCVQPDLGKGLSGILNLLRSQKSEDTEEEAYGRRNDRVIRDTESKDGFVLEYRDSNGRLLSTKEAFRQFSYQFHGKSPGKKNKGKKNLNYLKSMAAKGLHFIVFCNKQNTMLQDSMLLSSLSPYQSKDVFLFVGNTLESPSQLLDINLLLNSNPMELS